MGIGDSPQHGVPKEILPAMGATILFSILNTSHTKSDELDGGDGKAVATILGAQLGSTSIETIVREAILAVGSLQIERRPRDVPLELRPSYSSLDHRSTFGSITIRFLPAAMRPGLYQSVSR